MMNVRFGINTKQYKLIDTQASVSDYARFLVDKMKDAKLDDEDGLTFDITQTENFGTSRILQIGVTDSQKQRRMAMDFLSVGICHDQAMPAILEFLAMAKKSFAKITGFPITP